jgi:hemophore-related protein
MKFSGSTLRRGLVGALAATALGASTAAVAAPMAGAQPSNCSAAGLASTVSGVSAAAGQYLDAHPDANDAITAAGSQTPQQAEANLRTYFTGHPQQYNDLRGIAQPLSNMRTSCNTNVTGSQLSALLQAFTA